MIYYGKEALVLDAEQLTRRAATVKNEIQKIREKYFSNTGKGRVVLRYPNGERREKDDGFTVMKVFPIPLNSTDGMWRYSASVMRPDGKFGDDGHVYVKDRQVFKEKDIEFIWFLLNRSSVLNKYVFVEDLEADAKEENKELASDAYIRFMLMDKRSPIASNMTLIRQVAETFGLVGLEQQGNEEVKKALYELLVKREEMGDKFINFDKFEKLVNGDKMRKAAFYAKSSINDKVVGYKDYAWHLMDGKEYGDMLCMIKRDEAPYKEQAFIDTIINDPNVRNRLFCVIGQEEIVTTDDLRELTLNVLKAKLKEKTGEFDTSAKKEEVIEKLCGEYGIEYAPK